MKRIKKYIDSNGDTWDSKSEYLFYCYLLDNKDNFNIKEIHRPNNMHLLKNAINHIKYEELFLFMLKMNELKRNRVKVIGIKKEVDKNNVLEFINKAGCNSECSVFKTTCLSHQINLVAFRFFFRRCSTNGKLIVENAFAAIHLPTLSTRHILHSRVKGK